MTEVSGLSGSSSIFREEVLEMKLQCASCAPRGCVEVWGFFLWELGGQDFSVMHVTLALDKGSGCSGS